jgi:GTP:adenosylcobinamide-phosphate guanylyltransferase
LASGLLRPLVSRVAATLPYLATKDDLNKLRVAVSGIAATIPHLATKADLSAMETKIIKWIIATVLASTTTVGGLAFTIAKFVH